MNKTPPSISWLIVFDNIKENKYSICTTYNFENPDDAVADIADKFFDEPVTGIYIIKEADNITEYDITEYDPEKPQKSFTVEHVEYDEKDQKILNSSNDMRLIAVERFGKHQTKQFLERSQFWSNKQIERYKQKP